MSPHPRDSYDALPPNRAVVLAAVIQLHAANGHVTIRELCARTGYRSTSTVHAILTRLKDEGLVDWEDGKQSTLHPSVEVQRAGIA